MEIYRTEEEQIAVIQSWWKKNGPLMVGALVLALLAIAGWHFFTSQSNRSGAEAYIQYDRVAQAMQDAVDTQVDSTADKTVLTESQKLFDQHPKHAYAHLTALMLAKHHVAYLRYESARDRLSWMLEQEPDAALRVLAKARLAQVQLQLGAYDEALALLNSEPKLESFSSLYDELKGDVYFHQGNLDSARTAYENALASSKGSDVNLQMKLDDLAQSPELSLRFESADPS